MLEDVRRWYKGC